MLPENKFNIRFAAVKFWNNIDESIKHLPLKTFKNKAKQTSYSLKPTPNRKLLSPKFNAWNIESDGKIKILPDDMGTLTSFKLQDDK